VADYENFPGDYPRGNVVSFEYVLISGQLFFLLGVVWLMALKYYHLPHTKVILYPAAESIIVAGAVAGRETGLAA
jgi:hypothetical protein